MYSKSKIYIDKTSLEIIAQDSTIAANYYKNIIEIFRSNAELYIDTPSEELEALKEPADLNAPNDIFCFLENRGIPWPIADDNSFKRFNSDPATLYKAGNVIYILNIKKEEAESLRKKYRVWILSIYEITDDIFHYVFDKHFNIDELPGTTKNGWKNLLNGEIPYIPPSNSFVIADANLLKNDILDENNVKHYRGLENVKDLLSVILPNSIEIPFYVMVICEKITEKQSRLERIINTWIGEVKALRKYEIIVEFLISQQTVHSRNLYANNYRIYLDRGFYVFEPWSVKVHVDGDSFNKISISSYLADPFSRGDTILDISNTELNAIFKKYNKIPKNTGDPAVIGDFDQRKYGFNRIYASDEENLHN